MAQTKIKAAQFSGVIGNGTSGYVLQSSGNGDMEWVSLIVNPTVLSVTYPGDDTAADPTGGQTVTITGTGFATGANVTIGGTAASSVSFVSATTLTITTPAKAAGDYDIVVTNTDTGTGTKINGISYNGIPAWTTAAGSLGTFASDTTISTITLQASEPDAGTITFDIISGTLPTGLSLTGANIDGTTSLETADTLYNFTIEAIDDENQATARAFSITVTKQFINTDNFTINTYAGNGSTQSIEGKIGTAASFNGSSSKVVSTLSGFTGNPIFSISFWINPNANNGSPIMLGSSSNGAALVTFLNSSNKLNFGRYGDGQGDTTASIPNNTWTHVAISNNAGSVQVYINGSADLSFTTTYNIGSNNFYIGSANTTQYFNGKIDQVRIFNKAISSSEVTTLYNEPSNLSTASTTDIFDDGSGVALYEFEEGAKDTGGVTGYIGSGGIFNGSSSGITTSLNNSAFTNGYQFSVSMWVNPSVSASHAPLINGLATSSTGWLIELNNNRIYTNVTQSGPAYRRGYFNTTLNNNQWYHIVVDLVNNYAYLDGQDISNTFVDDSYGTISSIVDADWKIGTQTATNTYYFNGKIDQVRIFNKAISSSEVTTLYGETSASATKSTTDIFDDGSGLALYELEGNANDTADTYNGTATNVTYAYDGTPTNVSFVGTSFQPDLVWIKERANTGTDSHRLFDSVRGATKRLYSNSDSAESPASNSLTSFDTNGFSLGNEAGVNGNSSTYVAWCWKAGGTAVSNTDGTITSEVSVNVDAGFSIVKYSASGSSATVGHGLSTTPDLIITKGTTHASSWDVWHKDVPNAPYLNSTSAAGGVSHHGTPDSTTFGITHVGTYSSGTYITYCFHSVDGYQKLGSYTGNGSTNGPIITTGFRPRFILTKPSSIADNWSIWDNVRESGNTLDQILVPNNTAAESADGFGRYDIDLLSNGFQMKRTDSQINQNGATYIYLAIA